METIRSLDGQSQAGRITFESDRYSATATVLEDGTIETEVDESIEDTGTTSLSHWRYMPRVIRFASWILFQTPLSVLIVITMILIILCYPEQFLPRLCVEALERILPYLAYFIDNAGWIFIFVLLFFLWRVHHFVAPWHAAEHMAIAAYNKLGSTELETISQQDRVQGECGGRYTFPALVGCTVMIATEHQLPALMRFLIFFVVLELFFILDVKIGLDRILICSHVSRWIQYHITTRSPGDLELRTAKTALDALIAAHETADESPTPTPTPTPR